MSGELEVVEGGEIVERVTARTAAVWRQSPVEAKQWAENLREMRRSVLVKDVDYAVIPGTPRPSLLKSGAEVLLLAAGLGFTIDQVASHLPDMGVTYRCTVHRGDQIVAQCDGYAGFDEDRFYQSAEQAEAKERFNAAKYERKANTAKFVEYRAPWNSVIKMAQKRALVGATLNACAASGLFTQDLEDEPAVTTQAGPAPAASTRRQAAKASPAPSPPVDAPTPGQRIELPSDETRQILRARYEALNVAQRSWVAGERHRLDIPQTAAPELTQAHVKQIHDLLTKAEEYSPAPDAALTETDV